MYSGDVQNECVCSKLGGLGRGKVQDPRSQSRAYEYQQSKINGIDDGEEWPISNEVDFAHGKSKREPVSSCLATPKERQKSVSVNEHKKECNGENVPQGSQQPPSSKERRR